MSSLAELVEALASKGRFLTSVQGSIELVSVSFAYPGRPPAPQQINLHIRAGETVALSGPNGAGKSTLAHLLMLLMNPTSGTILIDGIDIAGVTLASLRRQIGVVPQHVMLFNGTAYENIAWGMPEAATEAMYPAASAAQAHEFVTYLPLGYSTVIGDHGVRLSCRQRQR